jgi:hypothetical protein
VTPSRRLLVAVNRSASDIVSPGSSHDWPPGRGRPGAAAAMIEPESGYQLLAVRAGQSPSHYSPLALLRKSGASELCHFLDHDVDRDSPPSQRLSHCCTLSATHYLLPGPCQCTCGHRDSLLLQVARYSAGRVLVTRYSLALLATCYLLLSCYLIMITTIRACHRVDNWTEEAVSFKLTRMVKSKRGAEGRRNVAAVGLDRGACNLQIARINAKKN